MARLILIRHGESVANSARRFTYGPEEPLSRRGREEAWAAGRLLLERYDPVALFSSPFVRALETARLIGGLLGLEPRIVDAFREQDFGGLRGRPYGTLADDDVARGVARWRLRPPGGETLEEVAGRAGAAFEALARRHLGQEVIVVSHAGVMAAVRAWTTGGFDAAPVLSANGSGFLLTRRGGGYQGPFPLEAGAGGEVAGGSASDIMATGARAPEESTP